MEKHLDRTPQPQIPKEQKEQVLKKLQTQSETSEEQLAREKARMWRNIGRK